MTNGEKYKTAEERAKAFREWCDRTNSANLGCDGCILFGSDVCQFAWLDLGADEEKPLTCPFCGRTVLVGSDKFSPLFDVTCDICEYTSKAYRNRDEAIAAHNRVARAVMAAKANEDKK